MKSSPTMHWKIFSEYGIVLPKKNFKYPFVDIFFYTKGNGTITAKKALLQDILISDIFPLKRRPYDGIWLNAPRNTPTILEKLYQNFSYVCSLSDYDHLACKWRPGCSVECRELAESTHFVYRPPPVAGSSEIANLSVTLSQKEILKLGPSERSIVEIIIPPRE